MNITRKFYQLFFGKFTAMTISKNFMFIFAIVSTASFSTTKASLTLSQVENLIEEKLRDVLSENTALKTDVLILKNANLAFHSKLENTKKNFQGSFSQQFFLNLY